MATQTTNYNLTKPSYEDNADIKVINENMDTIDGKLKENADGLSMHSSKAASTSASGHVQLQTTVDNSETTALTPKALNTHVAAAAPHSGHETPAGAQAKAEAAAGAVQAELDAHLAAIATQEQLGHVKIGQNLVIDSDGTLHAQATQASGGKKVARFVIGTSTSGWTEKDCDYLCDGTDDQEEIIQALNDLPATGGEVVILDGIYNITASINIPKDNVSIRGNGNATILKRMYNSTDTDNGSTARGLITLIEKSGCKIQGLQIDGNKAAYTANYNYGISLSSSSSENTITGNTCNNSNYGIYLYSSSRNTITDNTCSSNSRSGIYLHNSSNDIITGNACNNNSYGIYLRTSSNNNVIAGNTCYNNSYGIYLGNSSRNIITGNICFRGTGLATDYIASQYTIQLSGGSSSYNLVTNNNCMGKAVVVEGTGNSVWGNKFDATDDLPWVME
jgi:parallel beta-helix repeat protein